MKPQLPRLIVITDWELGAEELLARVDRALSGAAQPGDVAVQHRHPGVLGRQLYEEGRLLAEVCRSRGAPLFVNGRLDVALSLGAHLHLRAGTFAPRDVRPHLPRDRMISIAVHDATEAHAALGADFALVSPLFAAGSKPGDTRRTLGSEGFEAICEVLPCPAFALGGVTPATARMAPGARGAAVVSSVLSGVDPKEAVLALLDALVH